MIALLKNSSLFLGVESNSLLNDLVYYAGGSSQYKNLIFGGTSTMTEGMKSISGGVSILLGIYTITYGFQWGDQDLGRPQMLDISIRLPWLIQICINELLFFYQLL